MKQTIYYGGTILTLASPWYIPAILVEDGRIRETGEKDSLLSLAPKARLQNLDGAFLMPSFIDAHSHFSACASAMLQCSVASASTIPELLEKIRAYLSSHPVPEGQWVSVRDLDPAALAEKTYPDRFALDQVSPKNPLILQHRSGHVGVLNSLGLQRAGITDSTPDPSGGHIEKRDGVPTGYLEENAFLSVLGSMEPPTMEALLLAYGQVQEMYASHGITTVQEGMMVKEMLPLYQSLTKQKKLSLDVVAYPSIQDGELLYAAFPGCDRAYQDRLKLGGYKIFLDGSPQSRTAWMRTPYLGGEDCGYPTLSDEEVSSAVRSALSHRRQILAHCNGDAAAEQYLRVFEGFLASGEEVSSIRPVMVHAQLVGLDQLKRFPALGMIPSFFVAHVYHWGDVHIQNFGKERASRISPARSAEKLKLPITFHQDSPVIPPDMLETLWCACCRRTREGIVLGADEALSPISALKAVTSHGAYQYFEEDSKGTIEKGKRADLVILSGNPLETPPDQLRSIQVLETIKDGERIYSRA